MIARVWKGKTANSHAEVYEQRILERDLPNYQKTAGYIKHTFLKRRDDQNTHFTLLTYWEDMEAIQKFTGPNYQEAKGYPEDEPYLLDFPGRVEHFEVFSE